MTNKLYVGNLNYNVTEDELREVFSDYGTVEEVKLIVDRETNRSKGFAFVTMATEDEAQNAINELADAEFRERPMKVAEARERRRDNNRRFNRNNRY
jgi:RNA recognition motif-containing protein